MRQCTVKRVFVHCECTVKRVCDGTLSARLSTPFDKSSESGKFRRNLGLYMTKAAQKVESSASLPMFHVSDRSKEICTEAEAMLSKMCFLAFRRLSPAPASQLLLTSFKLVKATITETNYLRGRVQIQI